MRHALGLFIVLSAASLSCSSDEGEPGDDRLASGAKSGQASGGSAGSGSGGDAFAGRGGAGPGGAGSGGSSGSAGTGGAGAGGGNGAAGTSATGGNAQGGTDSSGGLAGTGASGEGGASGSSGTSAGSAGENAGGTGAGGTAPTSCDDPLAVGDTSRFPATESLETYSVMGNTADELRASMNENRGMDYDAFTSWTLDWNFQNCEDPDWILTLEIAYLMPEWIPPSSADPALVDRWLSYMDALYCHEYGHGALAIDCANNAYDALEQVPGTSDCGALQEAAGEAFQSVLDDCHAADIEYDEATNHGATMGAVFP